MPVLPSGDGALAARLVRIRRLRQPNSPRPVVQAPATLAPSTKETKTYGAILRTSMPATRGTDDVVRSIPFMI